MLCTPQAPLVTIVKHDDVAQQQLLDMLATPVAAPDMSSKKRSKWSTSTRAASASSLATLEQLRDKIRTSKGISLARQAVIEHWPFPRKNMYNVTVDSNVFVVVAAISSLLSSNVSPLEIAKWIYDEVRHFNCVRG